MRRFWVWHVIYPLYESVSGRRIRAALKELELSQWARPEALLQLQRKRLRDIVTQAHGHTAWYRRIFDQLGLTPADIRDFPDLERLPVLHKQHIADAPGEFWADNIPLKRRLKTVSGGTTGPALTTWWDAQGRDIAVAALIRGARWAGLRPGEPYAIPYGVPRLPETRRAAWRRRLGCWARNSMYTQSLPASREGLRLSVAEIRSFGAKQIYSCPSYLVEMARTAPSECHALGLGGIITSGETLFPVHRQILEAVFGCRVYDRYGSAELDTVSQECGARPGMLHITAETCWVEIVGTDGRRLPVGETGEIVVTGLVNRAMPLLRYAPGDLGRLVEEPCPCGRILPVMQVVEARMCDMILDVHGQRIPGGFFLYLFRGKPGIREFQLVQREPQSLLVRAVRTPELTEKVLDHCHRIITQVLGAGSRVQFEFVPAIERTGAGKFRYSISTLKHRDTLHYHE